MNRNDRKRLMRSDNKYNPYAFDVWVTSRQYCNDHAVKSAVIHLKLNGWTIDPASPTSSHFIVAYKPILKIHKC